MAKTNRSREIWHIPKRGSVHQTAYMVYVLTWNVFLGRPWSSGKQETMASELGKAGLTESGKALTHQSVRTLLANLPKYLGFVYMDETATSSRVLVTEAGKALIKETGIEKIPRQPRLGDYARAGSLIESSKTFQLQMSKLIITNPIIRNDCRNILVFPFLMTLRLLLRLDYLDIEEIGYILFHTKNEDEFGLTLEIINNFRKLTPKQRAAEIGAYRKTEEGILTLVKAPSAGYYEYLCESTGLCERFRLKSGLTAIRLKNVDDAKRVLKDFADARIYDFGDNAELWNEYFSNPRRRYPPINIEIKTNSERELLIIIRKEGRQYKSGTFLKEKSIIIPVFPNEPYEMAVEDLESGKETRVEKRTFSLNDRKISIDFKKQRHGDILAEDEILKKIKEIESRKYGGFDEKYLIKLKILEKKLGRTFVDNYRLGGRLEYLFFKLLESLRIRKLVDYVCWYGRISDDYGICEPAPGGKEGNPDIIFQIGNNIFVLELTTIGGTRAQWNSSEASSVPDHISKFKKEHPRLSVVGIFSAPSIHKQLKQNLELNAKKEGVGMIFRTCSELAEFLTKNKREIIVKQFEREAQEQMS